MTTIYIPTPITSAEQAKALPEGTVITHPDYYPQEKYGGIWGRAGNSNASLAEEKGWTALVPTEVDAVESVQLGQRHHLDLIDRHPFTVYIDYQETPE